VQEELELQEEHINAAEEFVRARTAPRTAAQEAHLAYIAEVNGPSATPQKGEDGDVRGGSTAAGVTLPSDRTCEVMRSRLALAVAERSAAVATGAGDGTLLFLLVLTLPGVV
jgi:hypothetical protein